MKTIIGNTKLPSKHVNTQFVNVGTDLVENIKSNINLLSYINTIINIISTTQFTEREVMN